MMPVDISSSPIFRMDATRRMSAASRSIREGKDAATVALNAWRTKQDEARRLGIDPNRDLGVAEAHGAYRTKIEDLQKTADKAFFEAVSILEPRLPQAGSEEKLWAKDDLRRLENEEGPVGDAARIILGDEALVRDATVEEERRYDQPSNFAKLDQALERQNEVSWIDANLKGGDGRVSRDDMKVFLEKETYDPARVAVTAFPLETHPEMVVDRKTIVAAVKILMWDWEEKGVGTGWPKSLDKDEFKDLKVRFAGDRELSKAGAILAKVAETQEGDFKELHEAGNTGGRKENVSYVDLEEYVKKYS